MPQMPSALTPTNCCKRFMDKIEAVDCVIDLYTEFASEICAQLSANTGELSKHNNTKRLVILVINNFQLQNYMIDTLLCVVNKKHYGHCKSK